MGRGRSLRRKSVAPRPSADVAARRPPIVDRATRASKVARGISGAPRAEHRFKSALRRLELLYHLVDAVGRAKDRAGVCEAALEAIGQGIGVERASVLLFDDGGTMRFTAWRGLSDTYRAAVDGHSPWAADAVDPIPILIDDLRRSDVGPLKPVIEAEGIGALGFFPLVSRGRLLGKFMVYHDRPHVFTSDETRLAATVAQHVAFGLTRVASDEAIAGSLERERAARLEADAARAEAEAANQAKDEFLAMLGHELRNPLAAIVTSAAVVDATSAEPALRRPVATITRQAAHLARLTDDLLDVARITRRRIELEREPVDLGSAVTLAWEAQRHHFESKDQRVAMDLPDAPVMAWGDPVRLQQVVGNLLNNASKYTPRGGSVRLAVALDGEQAVIEVADDGAGIPPGKLDAIFDLFVQLGPTLARSEGGLGIGLTLARRVVELHGGTIEARSRGTAQGATFRVRLPRDPRLEPVEPAAPRPPRTARRVLLIEDHDDSREALATLLARLGHDVEQAASGTAGIAAAVRARPQVVVIDIGLPDLDGYEVARRIRESLGDRVVLLALTGYSQPRDRARSAGAGFDAHLVKPVGVSRLIEVIDRLAPASSPTRRAAP